MNGYVDTEDLDAIAEMMEDLEYDESDESDESDEDIDILERRRRGRARRFRTPPRTAPGGGLFRPRPQPAGGPGGGQYVTQTQLQAALARVGQQIKTNSDAIKTLNGRVATLSSDVIKQATDLKKEMVTRKKVTDGLRRELKQTRDMAALLPLLSAPQTVALTQDIVGAPAQQFVQQGNQLVLAQGAGTVQLRAGTMVFVDSGDSLSALLPLLLLGGMGGGSGDSSSSGGFGSDSSLPLLAIALTRR